MPETTDPLANLLHDIWEEWAGLDDRPEDLDAFLAARLRGASVTLTQPQPEDCGDTRPRGHARCLQPKGHVGDHATARRDVTWPQPITLTQPQPDAGLREAAQAVSDAAQGNPFLNGVGRWTGGIVPLNQLVALRAALRSTPAAPTVHPQHEHPWANCPAGCGHSWWPVGDDSYGCNRSTPAAPQPDTCPHGVRVGVACRKCGDHAY